jgi:hypothetical protein
VDFAVILLLYFNRQEAGWCIIPALTQDAQNPGVYLANMVDVQSTTGQLHLKFDCSSLPAHKA